jgi:FkbM family methyltransferase
MPLALRHRFIEWRQRAGNEVIARIAEILQGPVLCKVDEFDGVFSINPRSHLFHRILLAGQYEPRISQLYYSLIRPDADIIDIGANVGFFTVGGAKRLSTGRLLAAEPTAEGFRRLTENVARNGVSEKVILFKGMVSQSKGQGNIFFVPGCEEYSSMNKPEHFAVRDREVSSESVPIECVDDLVDAYGLHPTVIKVDVEGAEFSVFSGAQHTLLKHRPVVISELWRGPTRADGHSGSEIIQMLEALNYIVMDPHDPQAKPGQSEISDIICFPKETYDPSLLKP